MYVAILKILIILVIFIESVCVCILLMILLFRDIFLLALLIDDNGKKLTLLPVINKESIVTKVVVLVLTLLFNISIGIGIDNILFVSVVTGIDSSDNQYC